jgi:DNA-binding transcriptional ArsR family regulator
MDERPNVGGSGTDQTELDAVFACLESSERRRILQLAHERAPNSVPVEAVPTAVAARTNAKPPGDVTSEERREAETAVHHVHLPKLTDAGLVERDGDAIALADHPAFDDSRIVSVVEVDVDVGPESLDTLFGAIADARRRDVLDVLSHQYGRIHVETLARELLTDPETNESEVPGEDVESALVGLHHVDLPTLAETDLVEYDPDAGTVAYEGHPDLTVPWMHSVLEPDLRGSLTGEADPGGIGEIEGRQNVVSFGQSLCERADDELFCMFTDTDLLEAGCLTRIRDASHRGVDVYLGTRDPEIREYVRENAPEVVLWEPNTDWLNIPVAGDRVGRLLLADREAVMLGTLLEEQTDGVHEEQAIVGEGEHDTLVRMIRQLLGPHLEMIDEGAADVEAMLPS